MNRAPLSVSNASSRLKAPTNFKRPPPIKTDLPAKSTTPGSTPTSGSSSASAKAGVISKAATLRSTSGVVATRTTTATTGLATKKRKADAADLVPSIAKKSPRSTNTTPSGAAVPAAPAVSLEVHQEEEAKLQTLRTELSQKQDRIGDLNRRKQELFAQVTQAELNIEDLIRNKGDLEEREKTSLKMHDMEVDSIQSQKDMLEVQLQSTQLQLSQINEDIQRLEETIRGQDVQMKDLESAKTSLSEDLQLSEQQLRDRVTVIGNQRDLIERNKQRIKYLAEESVRDEEIRKKLHNMIQELKGNIRVFCRVRPRLESEKVDEEALHFAEDDETSITVAGASEMSVDGQREQNREYRFNFDRVFKPNALQHEVFQEISQLVQSALDGYKVCIFAYGQTGSGKTFTMEGGKGSQRSDLNKGMIPRAVDQIFASIARLQQKGWSYAVSANFLEIYNESVRDLLATSSAAADESKCDIKHGMHGDTVITNVTTVTVSSAVEVDPLLVRASQNRAVAETKCNERSSRSHSVFQLKLVGTNSLTQQSISGQLNLIDLAGSERLRTSKAQGERLKETQAINKSLSALGDVISALASKDKHVPYRNSKLTYLLQHSLGGDSKTLMFVNVSPLPQHAHETVCSLRFAAKVNSCDIGMAKRNAKFGV